MTFSCFITVPATSSCIVQNSFIRPSTRKRTTYESAPRGSMWMSVARAVIPRLSRSMAADIPTSDSSESDTESIRSS